MKTVNRIAYFVIAILMYFCVVKPFVIDPVLLNRNSAYADAKIVDLQSSVNGNPDYVYVFFVNGKKYRRIHTKDTRYQLNIGDCYRVKYYPPNPQNCKLDINKPVSCDELMNVEVIQRPR